MTPTDTYARAVKAYHAAPFGSREEWEAMKAMREALFAIEDEKGIEA